MAPRRNNDFNRYRSNSAYRHAGHANQMSHVPRSIHREGARQFRTYDTSAIRPKRSKVPAIIGTVVLLALIGALTFGVMNFIRGCSFGGGADLLPSDKTAVVVVSEGEPAKTIGADLKDAGLVEKSSDFTNRVKELDVADQLKPGTYEIQGGTPLDEIIEMMEAGAETGPTFTVPEGSTVKSVAKIVEEATDGAVTAKQFRKAAADASVYAKEYPFLEEAGTNSLEGFLFPKTYPIGEEPTADSIIRTMLDQYKKEVSGLDFSYAEEAGLNHYQTIILASIVEKESDANVRGEVAGVFYNRLSTDGEPTYGYLQSDATTAYEVGHDPTAEDIETDGPYNTYMNKGLPPTPICSPGIEAINAVLSPEKTKNYFFYFEADKDGNMQYYFSETYEEHQSTYE